MKAKKRIEILKGYVHIWKNGIIDYEKDGSIKFYLRKKDASWLKDIWEDLIPYKLVPLRKRRR